MSTDASSWTLFVGQLGRQPRAATLAAPEFYDVTNDGSTYEVERAECEPSSGGRSFDSATEPHWRARDLGDGAYLRPYATDERPGSDRNVYKSAHLWEDSSDSRQFTERRKKTVRFDGHDGAATFPRGGRDGCGPLDWTSLRWESSRQTSQDSATKDSGIDTSSTFTSSEDSNRGDCPKVHAHAFMPSLIEFYRNMQEIVIFYYMEHFRKVFLQCTPLRNRCIM